MTQTPQTPAPATQGTPAATKVPKSVSTRLTSPDGTQAFIAQAVRITSGFRVSAATYSVGEKGKLAMIQRGATSEVADLSSAVRSVRAIVAEATKLGWKVGEKKAGGFTPRPDSFGIGSLPKPGSAKAKK